MPQASHPPLRCILQRMVFDGAWPRLVSYKNCLRSGGGLKRIPQAHSGRRQGELTIPSGWRVRGSELLTGITRQARVPRCPALSRDHAFVVSFLFPFILHALPQPPCVCYALRMCACFACMWAHVHVCEFVHCVQTHRKVRGWWQESSSVVHHILSWGCQLN